MRHEAELEILPCAEPRWRVDEVRGRAGFEALRDEWDALVEARQQLRRLDRRVPETADVADGMVPAMEDFLKAVGGRRKRDRKTAGRAMAGERAYAPRGESKAGQPQSLAALLDVLR